MLRERRRELRELVPARGTRRDQDGEPALVDGTLDRLELLLAQTVVFARAWSAARINNHTSLSRIAAVLGRRLQDSARSRHAPNLAKRVLGDQPRSLLDDAARTRSIAAPARSPQPSREPAGEDDERRDQPVTDADLQILGRADQILS